VDKIDWMADKGLLTPLFQRVAHRARHRAKYALNA
jgi:hypothetical protein